MVYVCIYFLAGCCSSVQLLLIYNSEWSCFISGNILPHESEIWRPSTDWYPVTVGLLAGVNSGELSWGKSKVQYANEDTWNASLSHTVSSSLFCLTCLSLLHFLMQSWFLQKPSASPHASVCLQTCTGLFILLTIKQFFMICFGSS